MEDEKTRQLYRAAGVVEQSRQMYLRLRLSQRRRDTIEDEVTELCYEVVGQSVMPDEKAHIQRAIESVEDQIEVGAFDDLTALNPSAEGSVGFLPARA